MDGLRLNGIDMMGTRGDANPPGGQLYGLITCQRTNEGGRLRVDVCRALHDRPVDNRQLLGKGRIVGGRHRWCFSCSSALRFLYCAIGKETPARPSFDWKHDIECLLKQWPSPSQLYFWEVTPVHN
eukprot:scaffold144561_cov17-Prasinocladus_malaysianus.AAC.1